MYVDYQVTFISETNGLSRRGKGQFNKCILTGSLRLMACGVKSLPMIANGLRVIGHVCR